MRFTVLAVVWRNTVEFHSGDILIVFDNQRIITFDTPRCMRWGVVHPESILDGLGQGMGAVAYEVAGGLYDLGIYSTFAVTNIFSIIGFFPSQLLSRSKEGRKKGLRVLLVELLRVCTH